MPDGIEWLPMEEILTLEEIFEVCRQASKIGIRKIKVTGGEPLVRKGCVDLIRMLKSIPEIEQVTLTTNGVLLSDYAEKLREAGIAAINVSLDTLDPVTYAKITGSDTLQNVLDGISCAERCQIPLKINAVLQNGINDQDWISLAELAREHALDVRFIEMMPIGYGSQFESISNVELLSKMQKYYGQLPFEEKKHGNGPAVYYHVPGFRGSIGFISAIHGKFCSQCNRIRLTSTGEIKPCLCYGETISLKKALRSGSCTEVRDLLMQAILQKPDAHRFESRTSITEHHEMSKIGG
jgi:cyclic pyranopterin phosphate synthase